MSKPNIIMVIIIVIILVIFFGIVGLTVETIKDDTSLEQPQVEQPTQPEYGNKAVLSQETVCKLVEEALSKRSKKDYNKGVEDALIIIMLHDLKLSLTGERMTWGERADVVRERLGVPVKE